jgi:PAS domain S-box-containing protein
MKILHLEDRPADAALVHALLKEEWPECVVTVVANHPDFLRHLEGDVFDIILSEFSLGTFTGLDALAIARQKRPDTPFIFLSAAIGEEGVIEAVKAGAQDYVVKDRLKRLVTAIRRALQESVERQLYREAGQRIREQAELLNKARDAIIVTDLAGHITFWNQGAERITGWSQAEVVGRDLQDVFGAEAHTEIEAARKALETEDAWRGEYQFHDNAGRLLVIDISATLIRDDTGRPTARLSIGTDVTAKRLLEERFLRAQRMESIGMLAAGIAHDLNNVLAPIMMVAPVLREHATAPGNLRMLEILEASASRGAGLVRQILAFAQGTGGTPKLIQVKHLLQDITKVVSETFPKNISFEQSVPNDLWPINANATQIHQVLLNLCVNARDAMPAGGRLILRAENCLLDEVSVRAIPDAQPGTWLVLHVEDTGSGIPPEVLAHIWEPFFTTKEADKGTGLGLSTVRGIVEAHKGFLSLTTAAGVGTTIRVYLPAAEVTTDGVAGVTVHPFATRGSGELVLVVDDEVQIRDVTAATLAHFGYRVLVAADGVEALALFAARSSEISVVVTDLSMPKLDGAAVAGVVQRLNPKAKVLLVSGLASGDRNADAKGFDGPVLLKPFKAETLLAAVHQLLQPVPVIPPSAEAVALDGPVPARTPAK